MWGWCGCPDPTQLELIFTQYDTYTELLGVKVIRDVPWGAVDPTVQCHCRAWVPPLPGLASVAVATVVASNQPRLPRLPFSKPSETSTVPPLPEVMDGAGRILEGAPHVTGDDSIAPRGCARGVQTSGVDTAAGRRICDRRRGVAAVAPRVVHRELLGRPGRE